MLGMDTQYIKNKIAVVIPVLILIFLCQHKRQMRNTFHLKTYRVPVATQQPITDYGM